MDGFDVREWRRYGKHRAYVTAADGTQIGWRDLATGEDHPEFPDLLRVLHGVLGTWIPGAPVARPDQPMAATDAAPAVADQPAEWLEPSGAGTATEEPWEDLAWHQPGQLAREVAESEWARRKAEKPIRAALGRILNARTDERAWRIGADGEEAVGAQIARLNAKNPYWTAIHAIPVGDRGSDIDHLVIGPGGVFTINSKHHPGANIWIAENTFMVNGVRQPYIRNARHEAARASKLLSRATGSSVPVVGVVVPVNAKQIKVKKPPADVTVVNRMRLARWLLGFQPVLTPDEITVIYEAAKRSTTWRAR